MKKVFSIVLLLTMLLCTVSYADQADELIATLNDSDRTRLHNDIIRAHLTNRKGGPYKFSLDLNGESVDFVFTQDEFDKLLAWQKGEYTANTSENPYAEYERIQQELSDSVEYKAKSRIKEYDGTTLDEFTLIYFEDTDSIGSLDIRLTWNVKNSEKTTKKMLEKYSDDLAATIHQVFPEYEIERMFVFWKVPYHDDSGYAAKYRYSSKGSEIYRLDDLGTLYGKN